jgi:hypothetical protein
MRNPRHVRPSTPLTRLRVRRAGSTYRADLRLEMIAQYGGACTCCTESHPEFLSLEHMLGDGAEHRREVGRNGQAQLVDLKRRGWPQEGYTVLCFNCNIAKGAKGKCPHQIEREIAA